MAFQLPTLDEIDGQYEPGNFKARLADWSGPTANQWGKPVVDFTFKLLTGPNKGDTIKMAYVGTTSQKLVDICTALNGGTYDPGADLDDYIGTTVRVKIELVTRTRGQYAGKTFANITELSPDDSTRAEKPSRRRAEPDDDPYEDDEE